MKILITGYKGFIGQNLALYFQQLGHEVDGFEYVPNVIPDVTKYDWVIHAGAISSTTETDVDKVWEHNFEFTQRLIQVCDQFGTNLQYASSASVYGPNQKFKETDPCLPQSPYAWSKYLIDRLITDVGADNFNCRIQGFRYFNVYGPGEGHKGDQMSPVSKFGKQAKETGKITLFKNSDQYKRDFVCVYDVCKVHELMMKSEENGIFNLGTGKAISFQEVAELIAKKFNAEIDYIEMPDSIKHQYQKYTCSDNDKLFDATKKNRWWKLKDYINDQYK